MNPIDLLFFYRVISIRLDFLYGLSRYFYIYSIYQFFFAIIYDYLWIYCVKHTHTNLYWCCLFIWNLVLNSLEYWKGFLLRFRRFSILWYCFILYCYFCICYGLSYIPFIIICIYQTPSAYYNWPKINIIYLESRVKSTLFIQI